LAAYLRPPFAGPLDLMQTFYVPKPEWYFLFLYQTLKAFPGRLEPVATVGIPLFVVLLLVLLPFIDRSPERNPARRPTAMICYAIFVAWVMTMAITGYYSKPAATTAFTQKVGAVETQTVSPSSASPSPQVSESAKQGAQLFNSLGCIGCHQVNGSGGVIGPELSPKVLAEKTRQWLITQIRDPRAHNPNSIMPPFPSLNDQQTNEVIDFLSTLAQGGVLSGPAATGAAQVPSPKSAPVPARVNIAGPQAPPGPASYVIGNVDLGEYLFKQNCEQCHGPQGKDKVSNPGSSDGTVPPLNPISSKLFNKEARIFTDNIDRYIQHGSIPKGSNPVLYMLGFGDTKSLTQQMITNVEAYVLHLNGVDRAQLVYPGIQPHYFFWLMVIVLGLVLGGFWVWKGRMGK